MLVLLNCYFIFVTYREQRMQKNIRLTMLQSPYGEKRGFALHNLFFMTNVRYSLLTGIFPTSQELMLQPRFNVKLPRLRVMSRKSFESTTGYLYEISDHPEIPC